MENNYSLAKIQEQYKDSNLLLPVSTEAQINPFYRLTVMEVKADLSDNSGDIFKVGSVKVGGSYEDQFSPAKPLLMKLAAAAGIQFDPNNTYGTRVSKNSYKAKAFGALRLPDGTSKTHCDEKVINLDDEEERFKIEFMDKSIQGITDDRAAKDAAKMFAGEWIDSVDKWGKPCKAYKIAEKDRQTYIDRSVMVNMSLLRKTASEKAMSGAILRVIRALIAMKGAYTKSELAKPFVVPRVTFSPDFNDPAVRKAMLEQGMNSMSNMFGSLPSLSGRAEINADYASIDDSFNPDDFADNAAFISDGEVMSAQKDEFTGDDEPVVTVPSKPVQMELTPSLEEEEGDEKHCVDCGKKLTDAVYNFSLKKFEMPLCYDHQKEHGQ